MLNVALVKNDVEWRPIVTKFGTLRTGLYDGHILKTLFDDFMRNSNFGMGVLHVGRGLHTPLVHPPPPPQLNQTNIFWSLEVSWKRFHLLTEKI